MSYKDLFIYHFSINIFVYLVGIMGAFFMGVFAYFFSVYKGNQDYIIIFYILTLIFGVFDLLITLKLNNKTKRK